MDLILGEVAHGLAGLGLNGPQLGLLGAGGSCIVLDVENAKSATAKTAPIRAFQATCSYNLRGRQVVAVVNQPAEQVDEPHLLDALAPGRHDRRAADDYGQALRP